MNEKRIKKYGFTLAEVLITLVIIGVVATITIPAIHSLAEKQEYVSKLKKAYSTLKQSTYRIAIEQGYPVGDLEFTLREDFFPIFIRQIKHIKVCNAANQGCFYSKDIKTLSGTNWAKYDRANSVVAADGVTYGWDSGLCDDKGLSAEDNANCKGRFIVDINGVRPPNRFGRDVFFFGAIDGKGIVPAGSGNNSQDCYVGSNGIMCAAKVLREGKMAY